MSNAVGDPTIGQLQLLTHMTMRTTVVTMAAGTTMRPTRSQSKAITNHPPPVIFWTKVILCQFVIHPMMVLQIIRNFNPSVERIAQRFSYPISFSLEDE